MNIKKFKNKLKKYSLHMIIDPHALFSDEAKLAYDACRLEDALYEKEDEVGKSPWCVLFEEEDLKVFEYAEDLELFYKAGPGKAINSMMTCDLVKDFMYQMM